MKKNFKNKTYLASTAMSFFIFCGVVYANDHKIPKTKPTADDQSLTVRDTDLTARIRADINKNDKVSIAAQNIKIIAQDGKVTLRGEVANIQEKIWIETQAKNIAGNANVTNNLTIKN